MENDKFNVLIVEDDFYIAKINKSFIKQNESFKVVGIMPSKEATLKFLAEAKRKPDLIFLDLFIPDVQKLELLWEIRNTYKEIDIIIVSAAKETATIEATLKAGIFDYLIKPIEKKRVAESLMRYKNEKQLLRSKDELSQIELDLLSSKAIQSSVEKKVLIKGIDFLTLDKVVLILKEFGESGATAGKIGEGIGASRSTARRYLEYLVSVEQAIAKVKYGDVGRPERRYVHL